MTRVPELDQQSIDLQYDNPLTPAAAPKSKTPAASLKEKLKDPKIKLLAILVGVLIFLLILTIVAAIFKKKPTPVVYHPAPIPTILPTPTLNQSGIPAAWAQKLNDRQNELQTPEDFLPPQIDTQIGL